VGNLLLQNESGTIEFPEFLEMAKVMVGSRKNFFESIPWLYFSGERQGQTAQVFWVLFGFCRPIASKATRRM
jgi:hypothetical protein